MSHSDKKDSAQDSRAMLLLMRDLLRPYHGSLLVILSAMIVETLASLAGPWPLKIILDNVAGAHKPPHWLQHLLGDWVGSAIANEKMELAAAAAAIAVAIAAVGAIASYIDNYFTESVGQWVAHDLRMRTYHHLMRLSLGYYDTHQTGAILSTITNDIGTIQSFASSATLGILVDVFTILGMLVLMFWLNWDFTLIALALMPFLLFFVMQLKKAVKKATHEVRKRQSEIVAVVEQGLESTRVIKAFERQDKEQDELGEVSQATVDAALKARKVKSILSPVVTVTVALCVAIVLWRGASLILVGAMTVGTLTVYLSYLNKFFKPVQDLAKMTNTIAQTAVGVERVRAILDADTIIPEKDDAKEIDSTRGEITFEHVAFGYGDAQVLRDVNFRIAPGQQIGVVGPTGAGKSTIVSLVPRFYDITGGRVLLDGQDVRDLKLHSLRNQISFVLQDTQLFMGTVRDNIAYGKAGASEEEIQNAAKLANAEEFIAKMPNGYDTAVGERGMTLSGGQRQRIGIARAILRDKPILILDEPTAALDTESERLVMEALERLTKGRTVITIAHRLSTIRNADKIIVLKDGVVAEEGNHDYLVGLNGIYAELYRVQVEGVGAKAGA